MARWLASKGTQLALTTGIGALLIIGSACAVGDFQDPVETSSPGELLSGSPTFDRPEVGRLHFGAGGFCTATLVTENVAVTAAHCVDYGTQQTEGVYGRFVIDPDENSPPRSFDITHYRSFSSRLGWGDVALLRLGQRVPGSVATPTEISARSANRGEAVTVYGYGCTDRERQRGGFVKRSFNYAFGRSEVLCPGDSGGPVVIGTDGPVFLVNSGYYTGSGTDIFGEPWRMRSELHTQIDNWARDVGLPEAPAEVRITNESGADMWARCDGTESTECTGWTFVRSGATVGILTQGRRLVIDNQDYHPTVRWSFFEIVAPADDVTAYANQNTPFSPTISEPDPDPEPDPEPEPEPDHGDDDPIVIEGCLGGGTQAAASALEGNVRGDVCANRESWFSLGLSAGDKVNIAVSFVHSAGDIDIALRDPNGGEVGRSAGTTDRESIEHTVARDGTYTLLVYGYRGASNEVTIRASVDGAVEEEDVCAADGNDAMEDAAELAERGDGRVCDGDTDWFRVNREGAWSLTVEFSHADGDLDVRAYDAEGRRVGQSAGTSDRETIRGNGAGFVEIYGYNGAQNAYTIRLD